MHKVLLDAGTKAADICRQTGLDEEDVWALVTAHHSFPGVGDIPPSPIYTP